MNIAIAIGRVIQNNEIYTSTNGKQFCNVKVSVDKGKDQDGNYQSDVLTFQVWGKTAEYANQWVHKGDLIAVRGRIGVRKDYDEHIGGNRYSYYLVGTSIEKLANAKPKEYTHEEYQKTFKKAQDNTTDVKVSEVSDGEIANQMKVFTDEIVPDEYPWE